MELIDLVKEKGIVSIIEGYRNDLEHTEKFKDIQYELLREVKYRKDMISYVYLSFQKTIKYYPANRYNNGLMVINETDIISGKRTHSIYKERNLINDKYYKIYVY